MNRPHPEIQYVKNVNMLNNKVKQLNNKKVYQRPNLL